MKRYRNYILLLVALFLCVVLIEMMTPKQINWTPSFSRADKIPYGAYILYRMLPELFPGGTVTTADLPAYNALQSTGPVDRTYMVINSEFSPDELDTRAILDFAAAGNTVFIAADNFEGIFADTLGIATRYAVTPYTGDSIGVNLTSPALRSPADYRVRSSFADRYFANFDRTGARVLGVTADGKPNFIRMDHGAGTIYLSAVPYLFTNYNLLEKKSGEYAFRALSYLPPDPIIWDDYYKEGRVLVQSPLRFIWSRESLTWAFYVGLAAVVLFILFMGKRRQRIIPEIKPLPNTTLEFVETVGRLYHQHGDHRNIAEKKIAYFLDHIRTAYGIPTGSRDEEFHLAVAARSGVAPEDVRKVFAYIARIEGSTQIAEEQLVALNGAIEKFHADSKRIPSRSLKD